MISLQPAENGIGEDQLDGPSSVTFENQRDGSPAFEDQDGPSVLSFGGQDDPYAIEALPLVSYFLLRISVTGFLGNRFKTRWGSARHASDVCFIIGVQLEVPPGLRAQHSVACV